MPFDLATFNRVFDTALKSKSLDTTDSIQDLKVMNEMLSNQVNEIRQASNRNNNNNNDVNFPMASRLSLGKRSKQAPTPAPKQALRQAPLPRSYFSQVDSTQEYAENQVLAFQQNI